MSVVAFERKQDSGEWSEKELSTLVAALGAAIAPGTGREWETGMTEKGDVQFYLLGPLPEQACELCVSRIGGRYILEDGSGRLLFEHRNLESRGAACQGRGPVDVVAHGTCDHVVVCDPQYDPRKGRAAGSSRAKSCSSSLYRSLRLSPDLPSIS